MDNKKILYTATVLGVIIVIGAAVLYALPVKPFEQAWYTTQVLDIKNYNVSTPIDLLKLQNSARRAGYSSEIIPPVKGVYFNAQTTLLKEFPVMYAVYWADIQVPLNLNPTGERLMFAVQENNNQTSVMVLNEKLKDSLKMREWIASQIHEIMGVPNEESLDYAKKMLTTAAGVVILDALPDLAVVKQKIWNGNYTIRVMRANQYEITFDKGKFIVLTKQIKISKTITDAAIELYIDEKGSVEIRTILYSDNVSEDDVVNNVEKIMKDIGIPEEMANDFDYAKMHFD